LLGRTQGVINSVERGIDDIGRNLGGHSNLSQGSSGRNFWCCKLERIELLKLVLITDIINYWLIRKFYLMMINIFIYSIFIISN